MNKTYSEGFPTPFPENTHDRIFNTNKKIRQYNNVQEIKKSYIRRNYESYRDSVGNILKEKGKFSKIQTVSGKPCNDNYNILSYEAKKI